MKKNWAISNEIWANLIKHEINCTHFCNKSLFPIQGFVRFSVKSISRKISWNWFHGNLCEIKIFTLHKLSYCFFMPHEVISKVSRLLKAIRSYKSSSSSIYFKISLKEDFCTLRSFLAWYLWESLANSCNLGMINSTYKWK